MMRLDETMPVRKALNEVTRKAGKTKRGNHKTWIKVINEDLSIIDPEMTINNNIIKTTGPLRCLLMP